MLASPRNCKKTVNTARCVRSLERKDNYFSRNSLTSTSNKKKVILMNTVLRQYSSGRCLSSLNRRWVDPFTFLAEKEVSLPYLLTSMLEGAVEDRDPIIQLSSKKVLARQTPSLALVSSHTFYFLDPGQSDRNVDKNLRLITQDQDLQRDFNHGFNITKCKFILTSLLSLNLHRSLKIFAAF